MIRLNRTTEYGLIALRHMSRKSVSRQLTSAREISDCYGLPFEITAKTLLRLKDAGLIQSEQGARGGYSLQRSLDSVTLAEFLELMEGRPAIVPCSAAAGASDAPTDCEYHNRCEIKGVMGHLNSRVFEFLAGIRLAELELK